MALKLIKGGKVNSGSDYTYISGCVTDTRLMGVLGLHLHWKYLPQGETEYSHLHQYFYYDIEEIGLDSIKVYDFDDEESARLAEKASFGGLGAEMRNVSEKEGRYLVCSFVEGTKKKDQPLPPEAADLSFILDHPVSLDEDEMGKLNRKLCTDIKSENEIVNYYLSLRKRQRRRRSSQKEGCSRGVFRGRIAAKACYLPSEQHRRLR